MLAPAAPTDAFAALAEPKRRRLVQALAPGGRQSVNSLVRAVALPQPAVSKHLAVLRRAGLVSVVRQGRHRLYALEPLALKPVHEWTAMFERLWVAQLERIKARAERSGTANPLAKEP